jgi:hypothetical protein
MIRKARLKKAEKAKKAAKAASAPAKAAARAVAEENTKTSSMQFVQNVEDFIIKEQIITDYLLEKDNYSSVENSIMVINELKEKINDPEIPEPTKTELQELLKEEIRKKHYCYFYNLLDSVTTIYNYKKFKSKGSMDFDSTNNFISTNDPLFNSLFRYIDIQDKIPRIETIQMELRKLDEKIKYNKQIRLGLEEVPSKRGRMTINKKGEEVGEEVGKQIETQIANISKQIIAKQEITITYAKSIIENNIQSELPKSQGILQGGSQEPAKKRANTGNNAENNAVNNNVLDQFLINIEDKISNAETHLAVFDYNTINIKTVKQLKNKILMAFNYSQEHEALNVPVKRKNSVNTHTAGPSKVFRNMIGDPQRPKQQQQRPSNDGKIGNITRTDNPKASSAAAEEKVGPSFPLDGLKDPLNSFEVGGLGDELMTQTSLGSKVPGSKSGSKLSNNNGDSSDSDDSDDRDDSGDRSDSDDSETMAINSSKSGK